MRVIVFFDLPTETLENKREYRKFRKFLIKKGFLMLQESVYCKLALNQTVAHAVIDTVRSNKPKDGLIQLLLVTEKQFSKMEYVCGEKKSSIIDSDEKLVIL
ncbi:MAG: CRISPR-associated endonuclease Cas2 [Candidatus Fimenecus sp.]